MRKLPFLKKSLLLLCLITSTISLAQFTTTSLAVPIVEEPVDANPN